MAAESFPPTLFDALEADWTDLTRRGLVDEAFARWCEQTCALDVADVGELIAVLADADQPTSRHDELLLALLELHAGGDELAGRLVLHRFTPLMKTLAGWATPLTHDQWVGLVVAAGWEAIATYPVGRRRTKVAANLACEIKYRTVRELTALAERHRHLDRAPRLGALPERTAGADPRLAVCDEGLAAVEDRQFLDWAADRAGLDHATRKLIGVSRGAGVAVAELARTSGIPAATLRQRRWRAERRMRSMAA